MSALLALVKRDLLLAARQGGGAGAALSFFLTVLVLLPLSIGPDQNTLGRLAPGLLWVTLLLSVLLSSDRIFQQDFEDGSLDVMALSPTSLEMVALAKALAHWLSTSLPLAVAAPLLGFLLNLDPARIWPLGLAMILGSLGLSLTAAIGAALTLNIRRGGLLISILVLPLYVPILIFGVSAANGMAETSMPSFLILAAIVLATLVLSPVASAAALRAYLK
jgi:heme exporter protein B